MIQVKFQAQALPFRLRFSIRSISDDSLRPVISVIPALPQKYWTEFLPTIRLASSSFLIDRMSSQTNQPHVERLVVFFQPYENFLLQTSLLIFEIGATDNKSSTSLEAPDPSSSVLLYRINWDIRMYLTQDSTAI